MRALLTTLTAGAALAIAGPASAAKVYVTYDISGSDVTLSVPDVGELPDAAAVTGTLTVVYTSNGAGAILNGPASITSTSTALDLGDGSLADLGISGIVTVGLNTPVLTSLTGTTLADTTGDFFANGNINCAATFACDVLLALPPVTPVAVPNQLADIEAITVSPLTAPSGFNATQVVQIDLTPETPDDAIDAIITLVGVETGRQLDTDEDTVLDATDNCKYIANLNQLDSGGVNTNTPDGIGNACQCGDVSGDGRVNATDSVQYARGLAVPPTAPCTGGPGSCSAGAAGRCNVGSTTACNSADLVVIRRNLLIPKVAPLIAQVCPAANP